MKQSVNQHDFIDAFRAYDRMDNFSLEALGLLFEYLENLEDDLGEEFELDVIAICCDYTEDSIADIISSYSIDISDCEGDEEAIKETVREYLGKNTYIVGETSIGFVYYQF